MLYIWVLCSEQKIEVTRNTGNRVVKTWEGVYEIICKTLDFNQVVVFRTFVPFSGLNTSPSSSSPLPVGPQISGSLYILLLQI